MRIELVRRCPGVPEGLEESLDRTGEGFCERCGETVVDLTRGVVPVGRVIRCARVLVVATAVAGCGGSAVKPVERVVLPAAVAIDADAGLPVESPASGELNEVVFTDDPLLKASLVTGGIRVREEKDGLTTTVPGR